MKAMAVHWSISYVIQKQNIRSPSSAGEVGGGKAYPPLRRVKKRMGLKAGEGFQTAVGMRCKPHDTARLGSAGTEFITYRTAAPAMWYPAE
jgi:hypothetical protein